MEERLQKYMARCGVASRRKCEEIILSGVVRVDDTTITELGAKVLPNVNKVYVNGNLISPVENKIYIALNKPKGYISSVKDEKGRETIIDLIGIEERIYPIGRLDYDTSGLILLTNDGDAYNGIIHPRVAIDKTYIATVKGVPSISSLNKFTSGIDIGDYVTAPGKCKILKQGKNNCDLEIIIHEGKNRQVRRMCDAVGHPVIALKRISVGKINLGNLKEGQWRNLTNNEIQYLRSGGTKDV